jgi:4-alpha-glucanotransferase
LLLAEEARELRVERSRRFRALSDVAGAAEPVEASGRDQAAAPDPTLPGVIRILRQSRAGLILLPLDDLAGETHPQNVPGTTTERPNWRRRLPVGLEDLGASPAAAAVLAAIQGDVQ